MLYSWFNSCKSSKLGGESAGGAIADILCGVVNPSGKLSETFPKVIRSDLEYPGNGFNLEYKERFDVGDPVSTVAKPIKELKKFKKIHLKSGEKQRVEFVLCENDLSYYNTMLRDWVAESGVYDIYIGSSSQDIRLKTSILYNENSPYTVDMVGETM